MMEKIAYFIIGASLAVVFMSFSPAFFTSEGTTTNSNEAATLENTDMSMGAMHAHPPRNVSSNLPVPSVNHLMFPDMMDGYNIQILTKNFTFTPANINLASKDNEGHAHIYVNGNKIARVYASWYHLSSALLEAGENEVKVTLNANDHGEWSIDGEAIASIVRITKK